MIPSVGKFGAGVATRQISRWEFQLLEDLVFNDLVYGMRIVPAGFVSNLASIRILREICRWAGVAAIVGGFLLPGWFSTACWLISALRWHCTAWSSATACARRYCTTTSTPLASCPAPHVTRCTSELTIQGMAPPDGERSACSIRQFEYSAQATTQRPRPVRGFLRLEKNDGRD